MSLTSDVSELFARIAALMEIRGESTFKVIAFQKVSRILRDGNFDLKQCVEQNTLCQIEGIGKSSQQIIEEYVNSGKSTVYEELAASVPAGLVPLLHIEGLGPKTIHLLWKQLNVVSLADLEKAIADGTLAGLRGMGEKKIANLRRGIELYKQRTAEGGEGGVRRVGIGEALGSAEELLMHVRRLPGIGRAELAGSLRRRRETIGDLDIVASLDDAARNPSEITAAFTQLPGIVQVLGQGPTKASVKIANGMQADLRLVPEDNFGAALLYFTGSRDHNVKIRALAIRQGMTLNEWGLYKGSGFRAQGSEKKEVGRAPEAKAVASRTEDAVYGALGLPCIEPELREDRGEIEAALAGRLPVLIARADIRGDLHTHTTASDGLGSIEQMAQAARELGYDYLGITDHSKSQAIANGLSPERLLAHVKEIRRVGDKLKGIALLAGAEVDILADGRLDYEDAILAELDIVIASPHFALKQETKKATDRLLAAIEHRYVNVIGHPTGRLINRRDGLPLDFVPIYKAAAANGTALEINASYPRLDLDEIHARAAIEAGVRLSINTDAHAPEDIAANQMGLWVARRAWVSRQHVINCLGIAELKQVLAMKR